MNIFLAIIALIVLAAGFYGIYVLIGKSFQGVPLTASGIVLILIWLMAAWYLLVGSGVTLRRGEVIYRVKTLSSI